jgi:hypothetical protein
MSAPDRELLPSVDLIRHTVAIEAAYTISRLRVLERLDDNPIGIGYRRAGQRAWCLMARHLPVPSFNNVVGLEDGDEGELPAIIDWYRAKDVRFQVEIVPGFETAALTRRLAELGFHQSGFHVSMIARPVDVVAPAGIFDIWRVRDAAMFEEFLDAYIAGWKIPDGEGFKRKAATGASVFGRKSNASVARFLGQAFRSIQSSRRPEPDTSFSFTMAPQRPNDCRKASRP